MIDISVIIPAYNCANLIGETLTGVFSQKGDFTFEVIVIDDGSSDDTRKVCQEWADRHDNLVLLHQENAGPSAARNKGLQHAKGCFIAFVDSDDVLEPDMFSCLLALMKEEAGMAMGSYFIDFVDGKSRTTEEVRAGKGAFFLQAEDFGRICCEWYSKHMLTPLWNKLYRKDIVEEYKLSFDETVSISEDLLWNIAYIRRVGQIAVTDKCIYHYIIRKKRATVTHGFNPLHVEMQMKVAEGMIDFLQQIGYDGKEIYYLSLKYITSSLCNIYFQRDWSGKQKRAFVTTVMQDAMVEELARQAVPESRFAKMLIDIYRAKSVWKLEVILKMLFVFRNYFHVVQRKLMKLLRS